MHSKNVVSGKKEYVRFCIAEVSYRSNGPQSGDAGYGGFLEIEFSMESGAMDGEVVSSEGSTGLIECAQRIRLRFRGDDDMYAAAAMFRFLARELKGLRAGGSFGPEESTDNSFTDAVKAALGDATSQSK